MNSSFEESFLTRNRSNRVDPRNIKTQFQRNASLIIKACNDWAIKYRPRKENQCLLFPGDY